MSRLSFTLCFALCLILFCSPIISLAQRQEASGPFDSTLPTSSGRRFVPHSYIVEFDPKLVSAANYKTHLHTFYKDLKAANPQWKVQHQFEYDLHDVFLGASFIMRPLASLKRADDASGDAHLSEMAMMVMDNLSKHSSVQGAWRDSLISHAHEGQRSKSDNSIAKDRPFARHEMVQHPQSKVSSATSHSRRQLPGRPDAYPPHVQQGIDIQHRLGNFGEGELVCVIDVPVDYTNRFLNGNAKGACLGEGCPISSGVYYYEKGDGQGELPPTPLPKIAPTTNVDCFHGTHVAGIIIADQSELFVGASPDARVVSIGAFLCGSGETRDSILVDAFVQAKKKRCTIVNGSFGNIGEWPGGPTTIAADRLGAQIPVIISAGNSRSLGPVSLGCPGCGENVISVASAENKDLWGIPLVVDRPIYGNRTDTVVVETSISWTFNDTTLLQELPVWFTPAALKAGADPGFDACKPLGDNVGDLSATLPVVFRGGCGVQTKVEELQAKGARTMILVADDTIPRSYFFPDVFDMFIGIIERDAADALLKAVADRPLIASISPGEPYRFAKTPNKDVGEISNFSSMGPSNLGQMRPHVTGIGGSVLSSLPEPVGLGVLEGTSMSAPMIAGAVALYRGKHPDASPAKIRKAFVHHGKPAVTTSGPDGKYETLFLGGGIVNVTAAINAKTDIMPLNFDFGDSSTNKRIFYQELRIKNEGTTAKTYSIDHEPAQSYWALQEGAPLKRKDPLYMALTTPETNDEVAKVDIAQKTITLAPNATGTVRLVFTPPTQAPRWNLYSGYIRVRSGDEVARVPYGGIAGVLSSLPAIQSGLSTYNTSLPALYRPGLEEQITNDTTVWGMNEQDQRTIPVFAFALQTPSERIYIDLVAADIDYDPTFPIIDDPNPKQGYLSLFDANLLQTDGSSTIPLLTGGKVASASSNNNSSSVSGNSIKCSLTDKAKGSKSSRYTRVDDVPVVGRLYTDDNVSRNFVSTRSLDGSGFYPVFLTRYPEKPGRPGTRFELQAGKYRVLLRAHRWTSGNGPADLDLEANYDSYLSRVFEFRPSDRGSASGGGSAKKSAKGKGKGKADGGEEE